MCGRKAGFGHGKQLVTKDAEVFEVSYRLTIQVVAYDRSPFSLTLARASNVLFFSQRLFAEMKFHNFRGKSHYRNLTKSNMQ